MVSGDRPARDTIRLMERPVFSGSNLPPTLPGSCETGRGLLGTSLAHRQRQHATPWDRAEQDHDRVGRNAHSFTHIGRRHGESLVIFRHLTSGRKGQIPDVLLNGTEAEGSGIVRFRPTLNLIQRDVAAHFLMCCSPACRQKVKNLLAAPDRTAATTSPPPPGAPSQTTSHSRTSRT